MAFKMKGSPMQRNFGIGTSFKQTDEDLKEYLIDEKGMTPKDADKQIADGAHSTSDEEFLAWYKENKKGGEEEGGEEEAAPAEGEGGGGEAEAMQAMMGMMGGAGGEAPTMYKASPNKLDLKRVKAGIKGAVKGALANEGKVFPGLKKGKSYPGSDIIQGYKGGVAIYDVKKKKKSKKG